MSGLISIVFLAIIGSNEVIGTTITKPPSIEKGPEHLKLFQVSQSQEESDKSFRLDCEASGNPEPTYSWKKDGRPFDIGIYGKRITQQSNHGTLLFSKPDSVDEGYYQCFAENQYGTSLSNVVSLKKSELNSFADEDTEEKEVTEGDSLTVECNPPSGYPKPDVFWNVLLNSGALRTINNSRLTTDPDGRLHFSNVTKEDKLTDGMYACSASSYFRTEYKIGKKIILIVNPSLINVADIRHSPSKQYVSDSSIVALKGDEKLELYCIYGGTPLPRVTWKKHGNPMRSERYKIINAGKTLQISNVNFEDEGTFECNIDNGIGKEQKHSISVAVQSAPYWVKVPNNTHAAEGESVSFSCAAKGTPEPNVEWFFNGNPLNEVPSNERRSFAGNALTITDLKKDDTGVYQCNASNIHGYAFKDFYINVLSLAPQIIDKPDEVTKAVIGSTVVLKCKVFGAPKPTIKWLKGADVLSGQRYSTSQDGDLTISDVDEADEGNYMCSAENKLGDIQVEGKLEVKKATKIILAPVDITVGVHKTAVFKCSATHDPSLNLEIKWSFNGGDIDYDVRHRLKVTADNSLTIADAEESDSGMYTCIAKTEVLGDQKTANATLVVQDVPRRPTVLGVKCMDLVALLEWESTGDGRSAILFYTIQYSTSFTNKWEDMFTNVPQTQRQFQLSMSPWANYTFRVIAVNAIGPSLPSDESDVCQTREDVPEKNPDGVEGKGTTPHNLVITWKVMPQIYHNAPGFYYEVFWSRISDVNEDIPNSKFEKKQIYDWTQNRLVIDDQPTFKQYRIRVEAHNIKGPAKTVATEVIGYSGEDVPSGIPKNFRHIVTLSPTAAEFSWDPVSPETINGHFKGYKIQSWIVNGDDKMREFVVQSNVTKSKVEIFKPNSKHIVHVLAFNSEYDGLPSDNVEFQTPEGTPGPVYDINYVQLGSDGLYVTWKEPEDPNGRITSYTVSWEEMNVTELGEKKEKKVSANDTSMKLAHLKAATKYRVTVVASTSKGEGEINYIEPTTAEALFLVPDEPKFNYNILPGRTISKFNLKVTWLPQMDSKPGSYFYVQYKKKGAEVFETSDKEKETDFIILRDLDSESTYEVRIVAVDGQHETPSQITMVPGDGPVVSSSIVPLAKTDWFIGMICAIALVIILAILVCLVKRNRGGKYSVHEKEAALRKDYDGDESGFNEYSKPINPVSGAPVDSRTSLTSSFKNPDENDTDSMTEYGEDDSSKFGEDGSFIGQYGTKRKQSGPQSPTGVATFV